jgi:hypothetical protein
MDVDNYLQIVLIGDHSCAIRGSTSWFTTDGTPINTDNYLQIVLLVTICVPSVVKNRPITFFR